MKTSLHPRITLALLFFLSIVSCQDTNPMKVAVNLDPCIAKVEIALEQASTKQAQPADNPGFAEFSGFDWTKDIDVKITVKQIKQGPACEGSIIAAGDVYYFKGLIPSPGGVHTLTKDDLPNCYRSTDVAHAGKVTGGLCKTPASGPGIALGVDLSGASGDCTKTCWQQWIKPQLFWLDGKTEKEVLTDRAFIDPAGHSPHTYGKFDRDLPDGSGGTDGHCYLEADIPGKPGSKGIVDAPAFRPATDAEEAAFYGQAGVAVSALGGNASPPVTFRFRFTVVSVLWCESGAAPSILGYFTWNSYQDYKFEMNNDPEPPKHPHFWKGIRGSSTIVAKDINWHAGTTGLDASMQAH